LAFQAGLRRLTRGLPRIARTHYPRFCFGFPLRSGEIPVFTYHDVTAAELSHDLLFLRENGYRTLRIDEYCGVSGQGNGDRAVLLTFDDARRSFFDVALPVLQRYRASATLFVPAFWVEAASHPPGSETPGCEQFMTWGEVRSARESDLLDVECHGYRHALVPISGRIVDFATPDTLAHYDIFDYPMRSEDGAERLGFPPLGTPIHQAAPLLSADRCLLEDEAAIRRCQTAVAADGGAAFFGRADWPGRLLQAYETRPVRLEPRSPAALQAMVVAEFERARALFLREFGRAPRFFAYPWWLGSDASLELAREFGLAAVFGVALDVRRARRRGAALPIFCRYKADWLRSLPGTGRQRLVEILSKKVRGLGAIQHLAH
jgi:peptidoglycan/xylan/chitin deacetylase (PgdA/CDA1 family)